MNWGVEPSNTPDNSITVFLLYFKHPFHL